MPAKPSVTPTTLRQALQKQLYLIPVLAIIAIGSIFLFKRYQHQQNQLAQDEMFQAVYYFEKNQLDEALYGDGTYAGLLDIAQSYPWTATANLAHFYIGVAYMNQGQYEEAIKHLKKFSTSDFLLQARAWALLGDAYVEQAAYAQAVSYYDKAANYKPNRIFTPTYLHKAALAHEANGDLQAALRCYQRIVQDFPTSEQYGGDACKHVARLSRLLAVQP